MDKAPSMIVPALIAGVVFGVIGGIPIAHLACCLWALGAGFAASYLYSRKMKSAGIGFAAKGGAVVGLLSGGIFGIVSGSLLSVISYAMGAFDPEALTAQMEQNPMVTPEQYEQFSQLFESTGPLIFVLIFLFIWLLVGVIFGTIGGLIGGSIFKNEPTISEYDQTPPPPIG